MTRALQMISGWVVQRPVRTSRSGVWHLAAHPGGELGAAVLVDEGVASDRLVATTGRLRTLALPGVPTVHDLVKWDGRVWLLLADPPGPVLAALLGAPDLDAGSVATVLNEVGETLLEMHRAGLGHGAVGADSVIVRPDGAALLTEWGTSSDPAPERDVQAWADLCLQLMDAWCVAGDSDAGRFLRRVAALAQLGGDLRAAVAELRRGSADALPAGFQERRALRAAAADWSRTSEDPVGGESAEESTSEGAADRTVPVEVADADDGAVAGGAEPRNGNAGCTLLPAPDQPEPVGSAELAQTQLGERRRLRAAAAPASTPDTMQRFGPGVPRAATPVEQTWREGAEAAARRGGARRRGALRSLVSLCAFAAAVIAVLWWTQRPGLDITDVAVRVDPRGPGCDGTAQVIGLISTNGGSGTVAYRWIRSDTGPTGLLEQAVGAGEREVPVTLLWTFTGEGSTTATATLEILSPRPRQAEGRFVYQCP